MICNQDLREKNYFFLGMIMITSHNPGKVHLLDLHKKKPSRDDDCMLQQITTSIRLMSKLNYKNDKSYKVWACIEYPKSQTLNSSCNCFHL